MRTLLLTSLSFAWLSGGAALGQVFTFQQGVNGYTGTVDTEFRSDASTTSFEDGFDGPFITVDQDEGSIAGAQNQTQGAIRFENIFGAGPGLIPTDDTILFAELILFATSDTAEDAIISFDRVTGADLNRTSGSGPWLETDTWASLGGDTIATVEEPVLNPLPIDVGPEAAAAPEDPSNPLDGILPEEDNLVSLGFVSVDVTNSLKIWQSATNPNAANLGWAINNTTGNGWDFVASEFSIANVPSEDQAETQALLDFFGLAEADVRPVLSVVVGLSGDLDFDGDVDTDDFDILRGALGNELSSNGGTGDLDFDADVDLKDFAAFKTIFNDINGAGAFENLVAGVPEPSTAVIAALAAGMLAARRRGC